MIIANPLQTSKISNRLIFILLLLIWGIIQTIFFSKGVRTSVDSALYINDAYRILEGDLPVERNLWYAGYSFFIAVVFICKGSLQSVMIVQIFFSGIAACCMYFMTLKISTQKSAAWLSVFLYVGWIKIHEWNSFIYTESLFTSMSVISITLLIHCKKYWQYTLVAALLLFTFFIRPAGFAFMVGLCFYFYFIARATWPLSKTIRICIVAFFCFSCVFLLNEMLEHYKLIESYAQVEIIYPKITLGISKPSNLVIPDVNEPPLIRLVIFMYHNPLYFLELCALKLLLFLGNVKPYYSIIHNTIIIFILYPLYYFAIKGFKIISEGNEAKLFIFGYVLAQTLSIALTTENWDGRFLIPILPFIFILSSMGLSELTNRLRFHHTQKT